MLSKTQNQNRTPQHRESLHFRFPKHKDAEIGDRQTHRKVPELIYISKTENSLNFKTDTNNLNNIYANFQQNTLKTSFFGN